MTTEQILGLFEKVRPCGTDRWVARCPAHEDRQPSMTVRQTPRATLLHCFSGCPIRQICAALGIEIRDLFHDQKRRPDPVVFLRRRVTVGLEAWRQREIRRIAEELRTRDALKIAVNDAVRAGTMTEDEAWEKLAIVYTGYSELEDRFQRLNQNRDAR